MSPAEKDARQMLADKKADEANEAAYNKASKTPPSKDPRDMVRGQKAYKKGGSVTRADGCITKGHTKGKKIAMAMGGRTC
jgi:hypothetical protein